MRDTWNAAKVGLMVLVALGAGWGIYLLVDEGASSGDGYRVWASFEDASGLVPKSRVLVAGIQVGTIASIRLVDGRARVDLDIQRGVELHRDASVVKRSASLLGEYVLSISPGDPRLPQVPDGGQIRAVEGAPSTDDILSSVAATAESVRRISAQMERTFGTDEGGQQMNSALRNLTEALEGVNRTIQANETVISNTLRNVEGLTADSAPRVEEILRNVQESTADVRTLLNENRTEIDEGVDDVAATADSLNRASAQLEGVLGDVRTITDRTARGEGAIGRLTSDERLVDEVEGVAEGLGDIVGGIGRLQTIVQLRSEYAFFSNAFKSYVELRLQPREDRYYYIQLINDPRGLTTVSQETITTTPPTADSPPVQRVTRVRTTDAFRFSFGIAKRIHFATFRFGIIESSGGLGLDLHFFDDNLEINTDLFQFGERAFPRLRTTISFQVVQRLWLLGGVDDMFNDSRDVFLGAWLRFNDDDLKSILPFAGGALSGAR